MPDKKGIRVIILGVVLIISALLLFIRNRREDDAAGEAAEAAVTQLEAIAKSREVYPADASTGADIHEAAGFGIASESGHVTDVHSETADTDTSSHETAGADTAAGKTVVLQDGYEYIGILEFPSLNLKLPVMADWSYDKLAIAPCRQFGSVADDDLVIAGHNYQSHFRPIKTLSPGDTVYFTDMDGNTVIYTIRENRVVEPADVDSVLKSGYDLVLYTCTQGGAARVALFCDRSFN